MMKVNLFPAKGGDCFIIDFENGHCVLVDGGYSETYRRELKPYLVYLNSLGKVLDYIILTHYDSDHINGLIKFFQENGAEQRIIKIGDVIVNGFCSVARDKDNLEQVSVRKNGVEIEEAAIKQEYEFEKLCMDNRYPINHFKEGESVIVGDIAEGEDYCIRFVSPSQSQLDHYYKDLEQLLENNHYKQNIINMQNLAINLQEETYQCGETSVSKAVGNIDTDISCWTALDSPESFSAVNEASLAFEITHKDFHLLFCGDADMNEHRDDLTYSFYDIIKLSHHGTVRGNECFFGDNPILSNRYVISTNSGRNNREHPARKLLGKIIATKRAQIIGFCFNYDITRYNAKHIYDLLKDKSQQKKYNFKVDLNCNKIEL